MLARVEKRQPRTFVLSMKGGCTTVGGHAGVLGVAHSNAEVVMLLAVKGGLTYGDRMVILGSNGREFATTILPRNDRDHSAEGRTRQAAEFKAAHDALRSRGAV
jgi:hypothetical protein